MNYLSSSPAPPLRLCHTRMPQAIPAKRARRMFKSKWQKTRTRKQVITRVGFGLGKSMVHVWNELGTMGMSKVSTGIGIRMDCQATRIDVCEGRLYR